MDTILLHLSTHWQGARYADLDDFPAWTIIQSTFMVGLSYRRYRCCCKLTLALAAPAVLPSGRPYMWLEFKGFCLVTLGTLPLKALFEFSSVDSIVHVLVNCIK